MIVFFIILSIILLAAIGVLIAIFTFRSKDQKRQIKFLQESKDSWKTAYNTLVNEKDKTSSDRLCELENRIEEKKDQLLNITTQIDEFENKLYQVSLALFTLNHSYQEVSVQLHGVEQSKADLLTSKNTLEEAIEALKPQIKVLEDDLKELQERKRLSILNENDSTDGLHELFIEDNEKKLISILNQIKIDYPDLKTDISTIEWRKIWLPKMQDLCNANLLAVKGIYRLVLKEDNSICYVGQAANIQQRWYEHVKKMIGVDPKGAEKLYRYRPEDFYWSVIETNSKDLNDSEHYWISYYGCKEHGLNKKV